MLSTLAMTATLAAVLPADIPPSGPLGDGDSGTGWLLPVVGAVVVLAIVVVAVIVIIRRRR